MENRRTVFLADANEDFRRLMRETIEKTEEFTVVGVAGDGTETLQMLERQKPDLVVMEFVNDSWMKPENVEGDYSQILADFRERGMEWIICTPHYVRADWMGLSSEKGIDEDPRPYVQGLRAFAKKHGIALADASFYYGQLYRQGIPYSTLMMNNINHPDRFGMSLFADALMKLFEE